MTEVKCINTISCRNANTELCIFCKRNQCNEDNYVDKRPDREEIEKFFNS